MKEFISEIIRLEKKFVQKQDKTANENNKQDIDKDLQLGILYWYSFKLATA